MSYKQEKARKENWYTGRVYGLRWVLKDMPESVKKELSKLPALEEGFKDLFEVLHKRRSIKFTCNVCTVIPEGTPLTKNKRAWKCDICEEFHVGELYLIPKQKEDI